MQRAHNRMTCGGGLVSQPARPLPPPPSTHSRRDIHICTCKTHTHTYMHAHTHAGIPCVSPPHRVWCAPPSPGVVYPPLTGCSVSVLTSMCPSCSCLGWSDSTPDSTPRYASARYALLGSLEGHTLQGQGRGRGRHPGSGCSQGGR